MACGCVVCPPVGSAQCEARGTGCEPPAEGRARFSVAAATAAAVDAGIRSVCVRARQAGGARSCARRRARARRGAGAVAGASRCAGAVVAPPSWEGRSPAASGRTVVQCGCSRSKARHTGGKSCMLSPFCSAATNYPSSLLCLNFVCSTFLFLILPPGRLALCPFFAPRVELENDVEPTSVRWC